MDLLPQPMACNDNLPDTVPDEVEAIMVECFGDRPVFSWTNAVTRVGRAKIIQQQVA